VRDDERQRILVLRPHVNEMNVHAFKSASIRQTSQTAAAAEHPACQTKSALTYSSFV
jgi:hypothetical protein